MPVILEHWKFRSTASGSVLVLPDGCRDLIIRRRKAGRAMCFVTELANGPDRVSVAVGDDFNGFRLHPDVRIDVPGLLAHMQDDLDDKEIRERLHAFTTPVPELSEALAGLALEVASVRQAAALLGVRLRSLQRLLKRETGRAPLFWLRLARVRRAAADLGRGGSLAELAYVSGYADQAHMTREFRHWLGTTPHRMRRDAGWIGRNFARGYGA